MEHRLLGGGWGVKEEHKNQRYSAKPDMEAQRTFLYRTAKRLGYKTACDAQFVYFILRCAR